MLALLLALGGSPVAANAPGLTLVRFDNTALSGSGGEPELVSSVEAVATCGGSTGALCSSPSSLLLAGRLAPEAAGRFGFHLAFDPPLPYPSPGAYARYTASVAVHAYAPPPDMART